MLIAVGIGNTTMHLAAYGDAEGDGWPEPMQTAALRTPELVAEPRSDGLLEQALAMLMRESGEFRRKEPGSGEPGYGVLRWCVSSVQRAAEKRLAAWIARQRPADAYHRLKHTDLKLTIAVDEPQRVGMDRLVAVVAVNRLRDAARPAIVVDAGTAVTVDLVDARGAFQGGVILPGLAMTARALSLDTDALPLVAFPPGAEPPDVVGKSTESAIRSGLFWGTVGAVREAVERMRRQLPLAPQLFITGGDARRMAPLLGEQARFVEHLVLGGVTIASGAVRNPPNA
jgi:type III pantothenate kinase